LFAKFARLLRVVCRFLLGLISNIFNFAAYGPILHSCFRTSGP
jgi:hypothetical protein